LPTWQAVCDGEGTKASERNAGRAGGVDHADDGRLDDNPFKAFAMAVEDVGTCAFGTFKGGTQ
jgi:hypothetical protein